VLVFLIIVVIALGWEEPATRLRKPTTRPAQAPSLASVGVAARNQEGD
jgi:hypothetical protein